MRIIIDPDLINALPLEFSVETAIDKAMLKTTLMIQNSAKENAPYDTWTLRRSIQSNLTRLKDGITVIWSPLVYARMQEVWWTILPKKSKYLTFKIGWKWVKTKKVRIKWSRYLERAFEDNKKQILKIMTSAFKKELW